MDLVYNSAYPKGVHRAFIDRYESALALLRGSSLEKRYSMVAQPIQDFDAFSILHSRKYLDSLLSRALRDSSLKEALRIDTIGASGTMHAVELALAKGFAYHLGGGYHHAYRDASGGYDYINDIAVSVQKALNSGVRRVMIIDLDVHHANGTQAIFYDKPEVLQVSFHGQGIFPGSGMMDEIGEGKGKGFKANLPLVRKTSDDTYLNAMEEIIPPLYKEYGPQLVIYQSGVDCLNSDPVGNLGLSLNGLYERDKKVRRLCGSVPVAVVRGGGYDDANAPRANVNTLAAFADRDIIFSSPEKITEPRGNSGAAMQRIERLKEALSPYWSCLR